VRGTAKLGNIGAKTFEADLCSAAQLANLSCSIQADPLTLLLATKVPKFPIPDITSRLTVPDTTSDGDELFCFNTKVCLTS
jgi:hypothetical protein